MSGHKVSCHGCGTTASFPGPVPRRAECESCDADLHVCENCRHHDASIYNECSESAAERVLDKQAANFCDWFQPKTGARAAGKSGKSDAAADLEKLFK